MTQRFVKGEDLLEEGADHKTWGITDTRSALGGMAHDRWTNRIEVYGPDSALRDMILAKLNGV